MDNGTNKKLNLVSKNIGDLDEIAKNIISFAGGNKIWLFYGEMGSGKTTLIKHVCKAMEVQDNVTSPTFSIINEYQNSKMNRIYHFDFYRIKSEAEAFDIGYEDYFYSESYCLVEWPEKIPNLLPSQYLKIEIETLSDHSRSIHLTKL